jgi:hypothetical protein
MTQEEWFNLLRKHEQEIRKVYAEKNKPITDIKVKFLAKRRMPNFPQDGWE